MISKYGTNRENHPSFDGAAWCVASGGVTKGRVYGAPRMPKSIVSTSSSSHSYPVKSSYPSSSYRALQQEIKDKEEEIKKKRWFYSWNEMADGFHARISCEQSWIPWWDIKYWPRYAFTYGSLGNDTYGSHISTTLSTYTSITIPWLILCRSTIS